MWIRQDSIYIQYPSKILYLPIHTVYTYSKQYIIISINKVSLSQLYLNG